jgi:hypothetical protein
MSELSMAELQAENVELLPERETLSAVIIETSNTAVARGIGDVAIASNHQHITVIGSGDGNTAVGSYDGNHVFF